MTIVIDSHTHVWPNAIAKRALQAPAKDLVRQGDGTTASLLADLDAAGVDRAVCLGIANLPKHVEATNIFAGSLGNDRLIGFGSVHVELDVETNMRYLREHNLVGVKLNPPFQGFGLDDPRLAKILDALQGEFIVLTHVGEGGDKGTAEMCSPRMIRDLVRRFPRLKLIAAHLGGYRVLEQAETDVIGLPVYIDTSWPPGIGSLPARRLRALIERHGADRVLFGSDWPMGNAANDLAALDSLGLDHADLTAIVGGNAERLLGLAR